MRHHMCRLLLLFRIHSEEVLCT
ncbi:hypothetical protein F383_24095 [Gossypium arboreum]|uniref:Uncharacterized protein n=1 Tax=Gossypium arboreum TaxID=29729 RepID=A0A0B0MEE1_GOSAR|nr:hypothetical protein F383_19198 [Gossypium arboreum]KHG20443.1 hypothetical protein F383_24095 [Gossypium arboreum]